jgi:hypothetical protein
MKTWCRWPLAIGSAFALVLSGASIAHGDPQPDGPTSPYPDLGVITQYYTQLPPEQFFIPGHYGVWFLTPTGINCGIWDRGGFGCSGDIPGAPPGVSQIGWFNGNRAVHYGWTADIQFRRGQAQIPLPPRSYVTFNETTCVVTSDSNTYCTHGAFRFIMSAVGTWYKGWNDRDSYACLSYGNCGPP